MVNKRSLAQVRIRNALVQDLEVVMQVEEDAWREEQRAGIDKFKSRLERFPRGFFLAEADDEVVAVSTSTVTHYDPMDLAPFRSWEKCTNDGYLYPIESIRDANALYIVSSGIKKAHRRKGIREAMIRAHLDLARNMGLEYTVTGAMMHGYDAYCQHNGEIPAHVYAFLRKDGKLVDPTLRKLAYLGLTLPDERHVVSDYYFSPEGRNYGVLLVHRTFG